MIYTNSVSVLVGEIETLTAAMGGNPVTFGVLLRCSNESVRHRLAQRKVGSMQDRHLERRAVMADQLDQGVPDWVHRVGTDAPSVIAIATEIIEFVDWTANVPAEVAL